MSENPQFTLSFFLKILSIIKLIFFETDNFVDFFFFYLMMAHSFEINFSQIKKKDTHDNLGCKTEVAQN